MFETARMLGGEDQFRRMAGMLPVAVYTCDAPSGVITFYNEHAAKLWGQSPKLGDTDQRFCGSFKLWRPSGAPLPHHETPMAIALREGRSFRNEDVIIERPDGSRIHVLVNIDPIFDENGRVVGAINAFNDVTPQRRAQQELTDLFENANVGIHLVGPDGIILRVNQAELDLVGYRWEEYVGHHIAEFHEDHDVIADILDRLVRGETLRDRPARLRCKDGSIRNVLINSTARFEADKFIHSRCFTLDVTEQQRAQDALRDRESQLRSLSEAVPAMMWGCRPDGSVFYTNDRWFEYTGQSAEQSEGHGWAETIHPDDRAQVLAYWEDCRRTGAVYEGECRYRRHDGEYRWHYYRGTPQYGAGGAIAAWYGTSLDIHDKKLASEALEESERRLSTLLANLHGVAFRRRNDADWSAEFMSDGVKALTGYDSADFIAGKLHWKQLNHPDDVELVHESVRAAARDHRPYDIEYRIVHKTGLVRWVWEKGEGIFDEAGNFIAFEGFLIDTTERRQADEALQAKERELESIANTTPLILTRCSKDLRYFFVNRAAAAVLGAKPHEIVGRPLAEVLGAGFDHIRPYVDEVLQGRRVEFETEMLYPGAGRRWVHANYVPERDASGEVSGWIATIIDITDRKRAETELRDSEERFRLATNAGKVGVWDWDIVRDTVTWSDAIYDIHDLKQGDFAGTVKAFTELVHPDDHAYVSECIQRALTEGAPYDLEFRFLRSDGTTGWVYTNAEVYRNESGEPTRMVGATVDITERKQAELAARENEERYELVIAGAEAAIWDWDIPAKRVNFSPRWKELRGLSDGEVTDREEEWSSRIHPDDLDRVMTALNDHFEGRTAVFAVEYRVLHKEKGWRWILDRGIAMRDETGKVVRMAGSETDITARKLAEEQMRDSQVRQRIATNAAGLGIFEWNASDNGIVWENDRMFELFGHTREDGVLTLKEFFASYLHPDDFEQFQKARRDAIKPDAGFHVICRVRRKNDARIRWLEFAGDFELDAEGVANRLLCVIADVTERVQAEETLRTSDLQHRELSDKLRLLLDTTSHLIETLETDELIPALLDLARELIPSDAFALWRTNGDGEWRIAASKGLSDAFVANAARAANEQPLPAIPIVVQPEQLADRSTPLLRDRWERYASEGIRALIILPMRIHGEVSSTLVFYSRTEHRFTSIEVESAQALANIAAAAITMSELYDREWRHRQQAEETAVRERFLSNAGAILAESIEYEQSLTNIARAAVPHFADWCAVDLLDDNGQLRRLAVAHVDPAKVSLAHDLHKKYPPREDAEVGVPHVVRTGVAEMMRDIPPELVEVRAENDEQLRELQELKLHSYICVPLLAGGRVRGAITFVHGESNRRFDDRDLDVAQEIAGRAAQAIENARLYENLRRSEERYRAIVEGQLEMVCRFHVDGTILFVNGAYARAQGTAPETMIGQSFWKFVPEKDHAAVRARLNTLSPDTPKFSIENRLTTPDGVRWTLWNNQALAFDTAGRATEVQSAGIDITKRKDAEEALRRARDELEQRVQERTAELKRRARQLSRLSSELTLTEQRERKRLAQVLHDHLQQILVAAKLQLSLMSRGPNGERNEDAIEVAGLMDEAIKASRTLTIELAPPILYEAGLAAGLAWLARWMHEKHGLTVHAKLDERAATEREDVTVLLFQSVRELLFNVVKHAGVTEAAIELARVDDDSLRIIVFDRGKGFDSAAIVNAGDEDGGGFGLFSIRERLSLMGGKFEFQSASGKGSRFILIAPIHVSPEEPPTSLDTPLPAIEDAPKRKPLRGKARDNRIRILLVDDHDVMRQGLAALLARERRMKVIGEASDGLQAIEQARALQPDVILMDFSMPRLDGVEATRRIKAELPDVQIVGLSIYEQFDRATAMINAGASAYHTKSDNADGLIQTILEHHKAKSRNGKHC